MSARTGIDWNYVELTPAMFLADGPANIMPRATEIFKRLSRIKRPLVFFKEVNVFQEYPGLENWFMSDIVSKFASIVRHRNIN